MFICKVYNNNLFIFLNILVFRETEDAGMLCQKISSTTGESSYYVC